MKTHLGRGRSGLAIALLSIAATGCVSRDIELEDRDTFFPSVRATIWNGERSKTDVVDYALEIDAAYGYGEDRQMLGVGENITFDGTTFLGPQTTRSLLHLTTGSAAFRMDFRSPEGPVRFGGAMLVGAGFTNVNLELRGNGVSERDEFADFGPIVGGQFHLLPAPWLEFHLRTTAQLGFSDDPSALVSWEAGAEFQPNPAVGIFLGWRWWNYDKEISGSDIDVELSGPTAGLHFEF